MGYLKNFCIELSELLNEKSKEILIGQLSKKDWDLLIEQLNKYKKHM